MKIVFVLPYAGLAGGIRVAATYARLLHERGHEVTVVSQPLGKPHGRKAVLKRFLGLQKVQRQEVTPLLDFLGDRHIVLDRRRPVTDHDVPDADIVVATWWETALWVSELSARKGRKFYLLQGYEVFPYLPAESVISTYSLPLTKLAVSTFVKEKILEHASQEEIIVIPNSVDAVKFSSPSRDRNDMMTIGFIYAKAPVKNVKLAIDVCVAAKAQMPDIKVVVFGISEPDEKLPLPSWMEFHQMPKQSEIPDLYAKCDLWLFTSKEEGFGLPILEAMACRTPVLATNAGAAADLINGENGFLLEANVDEFVKQIERINNIKPSEWREMSDAARKTATNYTWDDATDSLLEAFESG